MSRRQAVEVIARESEAVEISQDKVCRYLGLGKTKPDTNLSELIEKSIAEFKRAVVYRACFKTVSCREAAEGMDLEVMFAPGNSLKKALRGCGNAILFAATTGHQAEKMRQRAAVASPLRALLLDAVGTAAIESFCDMLCFGWKEEFKGSYLRPRFSPGYGDLPIDVQSHLLGALDATSHTGITLTGSYLMLPQKSVTAIIGVGSAGCTQKEQDCTLCDKTDCQFRL